MYKQLLKELGLGEKEVLVFEAILRAGSITAAEVASLTGIKRTTVYAVGKDLVRFGLVGEDIAAKKHTYVRLSPESLRAFLSPYERELRQKEAQVERLITELGQELKNAEIIVPKVQFIHQDQLENYLKVRTPVWNDSIHETNTEYVGFLDYTFTEIYHEWIGWYWKQASTKKVNLRLLTNESDFEKNVMKTKFDARRNIHFWHGVDEITYNTWINGDYTILINTRKRPFYLIEIHDENFARSQRQVFEAVWKVATM